MIAAAPAAHRRFPLLDGLRAIAALTVLLGHTASDAGVIGEDVGVVLARLDVGVAVFFVLSGFLLYRPFVAARLEGRPPVRIREYARRRVLRIVPAYWVALTALALALGLPSFWDGPWWRSYAFTQNFWTDSVLQGIAPAWTLCVEVTFYLALPFLAAAIGALTTRVAARHRVAAELGALAVLAAGSLAVRAAVGAAGEGAVDRTLAAYLDWFACGMALAVVSVALRGREDAGAVLRAVGRRPGLAWAGAALAFLAVSQVGLPTDFTPPDSLAAVLAAQVLYAAVAVLLVLPGVFGDPSTGLVRRLLARPAMVWLGLVSYGIFLYHQPISQELAERGASTWLPGAASVPGAEWLSLTLATFAVAVACAAASFYLIERPALRGRDSGSSSPRRRSADRASSPDALAATSRQAAGLSGSASTASRASSSA